MPDFIKVAEIFYFIFGAFTVAGGIMGFVKARSRASLIAGGISGALLIVAGWLVATQPGSPAGLILGVVVSAALTGRFLPIFVTKKAIFPAGIMAVLSVAGIVLTILAWYKK